MVQWFMVISMSLNLLQTEFTLIENENNHGFLPLIYSFWHNELTISVILLTCHYIECAMKNHLSVALHGKTSQLNCYSLIVASEVSWIPCNTDMTFFIPPLYLIPYDSWLEFGNVNWREARINKKTIYIYLNQTRCLVGTRRYWKFWITWTHCNAPRLTRL